VGNLQHSGPVTQLGSFHNADQRLLLQDETAGDVFWLRKLLELKNILKFMMIRQGLNKDLLGVLA
jgi:hypothetical protein